MRDIVLQTGKELNVLKSPGWAPAVSTQGNKLMIKRPHDIPSRLQAFGGVKFLVSCGVEAERSQVQG